MIRRLDDILLDRVAQPAANWLEHNTGLSPYRLASNLFLAGSALGIALAAAFYEERNYVGTSLSISGIAYRVCYGFLSRGLENERPMASSTVIRMFNRIYRPLYAVLALGGFSVSAVRAVTGTYAGQNGLGDLMSACMLVALYLMSCDRPPPHRRDSIKRRSFGRMGAAHG